MKLTTRAKLALGVSMSLAIVFFSVLRTAPIPVELGRVERAPMRVTIDEEGRARVHDRFVVSAPVAGQLERIHLHPGDPVEPGQVLGWIQPAPLDVRTRTAARARMQAAEAAQEAAQARLSKAEAALAQAERDFARAEKLAAEGLRPAEAVEQLRTAQTTAAREVEAARSALRVALFDTEAARAALLAAAPGDDAPPNAGHLVPITSPVGGSVLRLLQESQQVVTAGTPLVELGDTAALELVIDVLSPDAVRVEPGQRILIEDWGGATPLEARVRLVEPHAFTKISALGVEEQRVNVIGDFDDPPVQLGDGYRFESRIVVWESGDVLRVPASALFRDAGGFCAFVVEGGRVRRQRVEAGHRNPLEAEVLAGLEAGDVVVLHPSDELVDGARIEPAPGSSMASEP